MRAVFYNKLFSGLSISLILSIILSKIIFKSSIYFMFSTSFFGALYLLLSWLMYLKLDGVVFFQKISQENFKKLFNFRFKYKKKGVYNLDDDDISKYGDLPEDKIAKASFYGYLLTGIALLICSQLYYLALIK